MKENKTHIGVVDPCDSGQYFFETHFNGESEDIFINGERYKEKYQNLYTDVVDLCHQILLDGSRMRQETEMDDDWFEYFENEAHRILDILNE